MLFEEVFVFDEIHFRDFFSSLIQRAWMWEIKVVSGMISRDVRNKFLQPLAGATKPGLRAEAMSNT